eukprot:7388803-Prymnesium_polylepis.2
MEAKRMRSAFLVEGLGRVLVRESGTTGWDLNASEIPEECLLCKCIVTKIQRRTRRARRAEERMLPAIGRIRRQSDESQTSGLQGIHNPLKRTVRVRNQLVFKSLFSHHAAPQSVDRRGCCTV